MPSVNPGPASTTTINTQALISTEFTLQTIAVNMTPLAVATITTAEQSFGLNGASQATAATGLLAGDVLVAVNAPSHVAGVVLANCRVDPAVNDKFYVTFVNPTAGSVTPAAGLYLLTVARYNQSNRNASGTTLATMGLPASLQF